MHYADFVHLHNHTQYSLLDGANKIKDLVGVAKKFNMPALALTDHGNMFGAIEFYQEARKQGVKPLLGCEVYVAEESRFDKSSVRGQNRTYHLVLLCKNLEGYKNLVQLVSSAYLEGFYRKPRIDFELLSRHSGGLVALSACLQGEVASHLLHEKPEAAELRALRYAELFGDGHFFLEIQDHHLDAEDRVRPEIVRLAARTGLPLVCTNDCHYLKKEHATAHDALLCLQTGKTIADRDRLRYETSELYVKSPDEMKSLFRHAPQAIENTVRIAELCHLELEFGHSKLPRFPLPAQYASPEAYMVEQAQKGFEARYSTITPEMQKRLDYELGVIAEMGYAGYFLIVQDFIQFAREEGIPVGPGRGSAAGSLVSYALRITNIDPLRYGLLFERFLNPERISMPDIDIDFADRERDKVIDYVVKKYGSDNVAQIITFGSMAARAVVRDVGRVMGMTYGEVDKIAKLIPVEQGITLEEALEKEPRLRELAKNDPQVSILLEHSQVLEGLSRHASTHAAGVVIAPDKITNWVPLYKSSKDEITTQYDMKGVEALGLLKMDFLGLRTLTVLEDALRHIRENRNITILLDDIPLDDARTYELFGEGRTIGLFQFESSGMRDYLRKLRPERLEDLGVMNALYRPGPLDAGTVELYIERKHGRKKVDYPHPRLEPILNETYGVIVFQEQVMRIATDLAGFTLGQADTLRKAMGKKQADLMEKQREQFLSGCQSHGISREKAVEIFELMETFARYGFVKAHAYGYALVAYQTAFLKAHYPVEFMAALLSSELQSSDRVVQLLAECRELGVEVIPPGINESDVDFAPRGRKIHFAFCAVKNVGRQAVEAIVAARTAGGAFDSVFDFASRVEPKALNRRVLESLIEAGAFDRLEPHRGALHFGVEMILNFAQRSGEERQLGQGSLFGGEAASVLRPPELPAVPPWTPAERLKREKAVLGLYVSGHPLERHRRCMEVLATPIEALEESKDRSEVVVAGIINTITQRYDKKGQAFAIAMLEDFTGSIEVLCFGDSFKEFETLLVADRMVMVAGWVSTREGERPKIRARRVTDIRNAWEEPRLAVRLALQGDAMANGGVKSLLGMLEAHPGATPVILSVTLPQEEVTLRASRHSVKLTDRLLTDLEELLGTRAVQITRNGTID
jgi:DNA polymerase-3 subunit alpha